MFNTRISSTSGFEEAVREKATGKSGGTGFGASYGGGYGPVEGYRDHFA